MPTIFRVYNGAEGFQGLVHRIVIAETAEDAIAAAKRSGMRQLGPDRWSADEIEFDEHGVSTGETGD